ncbi:hypothetical protein M514_26852 [Trichuris suis]|uniref:CCHC-type domain-containing protein n=1 Tax=Trichuris suis TaxID=68888 RepID=A0A085MUQ8_9BILA|nr:hypothetical protein M514_26852 [Trichuris suis]
MAEKESSSFPKLNGVNYHDWRFNMEWMLKKKKLWKYVDGSTVRPEPTSANVAEVQRFDEQSEIAQATIVLAIEPLQQQHIRDCESARDVWLKLEAAFEPKSRPRMMQLTRALIENKCAESEPMEDYVTRTRRLAAQLKEAGLEFKDDQLTTIMIANLPSSYDSVAAVIMNWDERKYVFDNVKEALLTECCRRQQQAAQRGDATEALATKTTVSCATVRKNIDRGAQRRGKIVCFSCRKTGHIARQCRNKSAWQVQKQAKDSELNVQLEATNADAFILDSGAPHLQQEGLVLKISCDGTIVRDCESARDVWLKLEAAFEPKSRPRMIQLTRALIENKCAETEPMEDYVTRTGRLAAQLKEAGLEFKDDQLTTIMIANLPSSYDSVAAVIMNWDERKYAFDNVKEGLLTEYCRRQQQAAQRGDATEALATKTKVSYATVRKNIDRGAQRRGKIVCFSCRKTGRIARQCRNKIGLAGAEASERQWAECSIGGNEC